MARLVGWIPPVNTIAFSIADKEPVPKKSSVKHSVWMEEITGYFNCGYILQGMLKFRKVISVGDDGWI